jgi:hypothetical protein
MYQNELYFSVLRALSSLIKRMLDTMAATAIIPLATKARTSMLGDSQHQLNIANIVYIVAASLALIATCFVVVLGNRICKRCFVTVGTAEEATHLTMLEDAHVCDKWRLEVIDILAPHRPPSSQSVFSQRIYC